MISATAAYASYSRNIASATAKVASEQTTKRATVAFERAVAKVEDIDDFMDDKAIYNYALKAFGLEDMAGSKGLIRAVLSGGSAAGSLASRMADGRYLELAKAFAFDADGTAVFSASTEADTEAAYYRQNIETAAGQANNGARLALNFQRKASGITSAYGILADKNLLTVVRTALGLPQTISYLSIDSQARLIASKMNISDLADPAKVAKLVAKFTARYDAEQSDAASNPVVSLLESLRSTQGGYSTPSFDAIWAVL